MLLRLPMPQRLPLRAACGLLRPAVGQQVDPHPLGSISTAFAIPDRTLSHAGVFFPYQKEFSK